MTTRTLNTATYTKSAKAKEFEAKLRAIDPKSSDQESQVALVWLPAIEKHWKKVSITRYKHCDAYVSIDKKALLIEFKADVDMQDATVRAKVLAQAIQYYTRFLNGKTNLRTPDVIFVADRNECWALHINYVNQYVNMVDEKLAPSEQWKNAKLLEALVKDAAVQEQSIVYHIDDPDFDPEKIFDAIDAMANGIARIVPITAATLKKGFDYFSTKILKSTEGMSANEVVGRFYGYLKSQDDAIIMNGKLMGVDGYAPVAVDEVKARQFKARFGAFTENDHRELERLYDTLVSEAERRRGGQFFTGKLWVDEAHRRIARVAGQDWEESCLVWDGSCGTKSLTRDYEFGNLFLSTIDPNELKCSDSLSTEAKETFVWDFLNCDIATLPKTLVEALKANKDKKIVFIQNPPYSGTGEGANKGGDSKKESSKTAVKSRMMEKGLGKAANELTVQFLYRMMEIVKEFKLTNVTVGLFSSPSWITGDACEKFRKEWLDVFTFNNSFAFPSEEFSGVKPGWAINFSVWNMEKPTGKKSSKPLQTEFPVDLMENQDGQDLVCIGTHTYYNLDGQEKMSDWVKGPLPKTVSSINTTDGIKIKTDADGTARGRWCAGSLGCAVLSSNCVEANAQFVGLFSIPFSRGNCFNLLPENFDRAVSGFAARRLVVDEVWNHQDCYMAPDTANPKYSEWQKDCFVFSMFEAKSNQTSIKGEVDGDAYEFLNQFYPFTKKETYQLLGLQWKENSKDAKRFIADKLTDLTPEGQKVLDDFKACLKASASARPAYAKAHPELQVQRWDCGWRQLKGLFEEACPKEFATLKADFKTLKDKMLPQVYELGFLRK